ncbi:uncharacterized protein LOC144168795 [Haemaphysalis longicornis]
MPVTQAKVPRWAERWRHRFHGHPVQDLGTQHTSNCRLRPPWESTEWVHNVDFGLWRTWLGCGGLGRGRPPQLLTTQVSVASSQGRRFVPVSWALEKLDASLCTAWPQVVGAVGLQ